MTARLARRLLTVLVAVVLAGATAVPAAAQEEDPPYPSAAWSAREAANYARTQEAPRQQAQDPAFQQRWKEQSATNFLAYQQRRVEDPDWRSDGNLCATWGEQCTGDPFRYPGVDPFYEEEGEVEPVAFLDRGGARLSGRVWAPAGSGPGDALPLVVIINGSVQAPETLYWWGAQALARAGYVVVTFDPRGQGRSDSSTPDGEPGSNANPDVFATNLIDAIDFALSTPDAPYEPNAGDDRATTPHNPFWDRIDSERVGAIGHSLGARGVTVVQGVEPWPGTGEANPIDVIVAWDNLGLTDGGGSEGGLAGFATIPRVPAMGQSGDYFLTPEPYTAPPEPDAKRQGFLQWQAAGVPSYQLVIEGGTHYEWSLLPTFPTTAWEPGGPSGWGRPLAEHYTVAWMDRWLKQPAEPGHADADARLLADDALGPDGAATWRDRLSFYYRSSRDFPDRTGRDHVCEDIRLGCPAAARPDAPPGGAPDGGAAPTPSPPRPGLPATGGGAASLALGALLAAGALRRRRYRGAP